MIGEFDGEHAIETLIRLIGDDPKRPGLWDTPQRVLSSYKELFSGYKTNVPALFKTFEQEGTGYTGLVRATNISVMSFCEHHLLPFFCSVEVGYVPGPAKAGESPRLLGLSKIPRVVEAFAKRLQVQERLTQQVVDAFVTHLAPAGAYCVVKAKHTCLCERGVGQPDVWTETRAAHGCCKPDSREQLIKGVLNGIQLLDASGRV